MTVPPGDATIVGDDAAAIAVDQAADEFLGGLVDEVFLPRLQPDRPVVLLAGAVLREEARPVLGVQVDIGAVVGAP
ncbi:hypothetical protein MNVM_05070 [Mycobacterium novum]|uniref:Uncharacterized protein n=2 Tax=Mycobacteriaceae TaxID=1762 RepID=A0A7I9Y770_MYCAL|nr:hypothetical protein MNVM_05070 [Mycobacterium novum]GFG84313.1 hypothetical protein MALGJ_09890 [Mycolicibacter algericus]